MHRLIILSLLGPTLLGLFACAASPPTRNFEKVPPGKVYEGGYINITAPNSDGWHLVESSSTGMAFARRGKAPNESFAAQVVFFNLPQTSTPEEFEALIAKQAERDAETDRFSTSKFTHKYTEVRGYPCVEIHNISEDKQAQTGPNKTERLALENRHLYCRHPVRTDTGFVVSYSHRGSGLYPDLHTEARDFIEGVQAPAGP